MVFLYCQQETDTAERRANSATYDFIPYKYGAFSFTSLHDLGRLQVKRIVKNQGEEWHLTTLGLSLSDGCTYRIMRELGLLHRRVKTSADYQQARYLFDLLPRGPNQVWQMDITYLALPQQWWYVVTVIDYYSRYQLGCYLTPFQNAAAVVHSLSLALQEAERIHGSLLGSPTLVTDNGACFLSRKFRTYVQSRFHHVRIQYRTPQQLGLLERFHGTLKLEEIYWRYYDNPQEARTGLESFRYRYNYQRPYWA